MKYHIITYGCQMNKSDAERLAAILENLGYQKTDDEKSADLVAIVACSVRQSAVDRIYGKIKAWRPKKPGLSLDKLGVNGIGKKLSLGFARDAQFGKQKMKFFEPNWQKIILTGCLMPKDRKALKDKVDLIINLNNLNKLPTLLGIENQESKISDYLNIIPKYQSQFQAYVPISTGCNNYCSYCVVPYARGPEKHRSAEEIIAEIKSLIKNGYKEITLLGQNVNSYGIKHENITNKNTKLTKNVHFPQLLKIINDLPGDFWLRFVTSHPKDLSDQLIRIMANGKKICEHLHLPVQSGDNQVLRAMNRHYTIARYKNLIKKIRRAIPKIAISTDIIVGFPGETQKQFNNTVKLMKEINFDMAYIAEYSPRPGTAAARLIDNIPKKEKERRRIILTEILKKSALKNNKNYLNKTVEILIDGQKKDNYYGKTRTFKTVKISTQTALAPRLSAKSRHANVPIRILATKKSPEVKIGDFVKVKIIKANPFGLEGVISE